MRRSFHYHILDELVGELAALGENAFEYLKASSRGQGAEKEQPRDLFKAEASLLLASADYLANIDSAVYKSAVYRDTLAVLDIISLNAAYLCQPRHNTGAVRISQTALDLETIKIRRIYLVILVYFFA